MKINKIKYYSARGIKLIIFIVFLLSQVSCTKNFTEINTPTDAKSVSSIDASLLGQAFAQAQYRGLFGGTTEFQVIHNLYCDFYSQYFATTHPNFPSDQFQEVPTWTGRYGWDTQYGVAAPQVKFVVDFTASHSMTVANAIARVWKVYFFDRLTDLWGPIIYSQFGNNERSVAYDSQQDIYHDFFKQLDTAVDILKANPGANAFGNNDQIYSGKANKWLIYANSLRLRLAMRLSYIEPALAKQEGEKAVTAGVMTVNDDNAELLTTPINSLNFYAQITYINEFRMSATPASIMGGYQDPRLSVYFAPAEVGGGFAGIRNGLSRAEKGDRINLQLTHSFVAQKYRPIANGGTSPPWEVMNAAEVYFLRAEGALRGWNMGGTAQDLYNTGIKTSLMEWTNLSSAQIEAYVNSTNTPMALNDQWNTPAESDIPVAYLTNASFEKQLEQIITQKWIAIFPNSEEAWAERRRTGYPIGFPIIESLNPNVTANALMRRLTFAEGEFNTNSDAVQKAITLLGPGGDKNSTKLWWDAK